MVVPTTKAGNYGKGSSGCFGQEDGFGFGPVEFKVSEMPKRQLDTEELPRGLAGDDILVSSACRA